MFHYSNSLFSYWVHGIGLVIMIDLTEVMVIVILARISLSCLSLNEKEKTPKKYIQNNGQQ